MHVSTRRERGVLHPVEGLRGKSRSGFILVSGRFCNHKCAHCLVDAGPHRKEKAGLIMAGKIMEGIRPNLANEHVNFVAVIGGEPLFHLDFIEEIGSNLERVCSRSYAKVPRMIIETNGTVSGPEIYKILKPLKERLTLWYSPDEFHPEASQMRMFEREGFAVESRSPSKKIAALGRAFGMEGDYSWKTDCDAAFVRYEMSRGIPVILGRGPSTKKFMVFENGETALCGYGGMTFGNLAKENTFAIAERIERDERAVALMERGPLGLAEVLGKAKEAVEVFRQKGSCGICHALKEKLI